MLSDHVDASGIYVITNMINGNQYVGKAKSVRRRWYQHNNGSKSGNKYLYRAIRKYGIDNFTMSIIDCEYSNDREVYWISELKPKYNMIKGGDGGWINDQTGKRWKIKDTSRMKEANNKKFGKTKEIVHSKNI